jgi:hypothetical protein
VNELDLGNNLQNAFDYAKKMTEDAGRWIILIVLAIIPIINLIVIGYAARVVKETPSSKSPPKLERYVDLWVKGLMVVIALIIYMIVPLIVFGFAIASFVLAFVGGAGMTRGMPGPIWSMPMIGVGGGLILIGIIVTFIFAIIAVMGILHMIYTDKFGKAFAFREIIGKIKKIGWGSYLLWLIVIFIINIIFGAIGNIPWIGWVVTLILSPPFVVFISRSAGLLYEGFASSDEQTTLEKKDGTYCIQCGTPIPEGGKYCPKCGAEK